MSVSRRFRGRAWLVLSLAFLLTIPNLLAASMPDGEGAEAYHDPGFPTPFSDDERVLFDRVRHIFGQAGNPLPRLDAGLRRAALAEAAGLLATSPEDRETRKQRDMRGILRHHGVSDFQVRGGFAASSDKKQLIAGLAAWAAKRVEAGWNRIGVALASNADETAAAVFLTRRVVQLEAIPQRIKRKGTLELTGRTATGVKKVVFYMSGPDGRIKKIKPLRLPSGGISAEIEIAKPGRYAVEVMATEEAGPKVAALLHVCFGDCPSGDAPVLSGSLDAGDPESAQRDILAWINARRAEARRKPLLLDDRLTDIESAYLKTLPDDRALAHQNPQGRDAGARLKAAGLDLAVYGENLGRHKRLSGLLKNLQDSPAHLSNLLSAAFTHVGIAVRRNPNDGRWTVGQLFAAFEEAAVWPAVRMVKPPSTFWKALHENRRVQNAPAMGLYRKYMNLARTHLRAQIKNGQIDPARLRAGVQMTLNADPNDPIRMVALFTAASFDELAEFSGFVQPQWNVLGLAVARLKNGQLAALALLGVRLEAERR